MPGHCLSRLCPRSARLKPATHTRTINTSQERKRSRIQEHPQPAALGAGALALPCHQQGLSGHEKQRKETVTSVPCLVLPQTHQGLPHIRQLHSAREPRILQDSLRH